MPPSARSNSATGDRVRGRQALRLLWTAGPRLALACYGWAGLTVLVPAAVIAALGLVVGAIPGAVEHGMSSPAGHTLVQRLVLAAGIYALSLVLDPIGGALSTATKARITAGLQARLLAAVSGPPGIAHLEDPQVLDRLDRAEGSLAGLFPGDAPLTYLESVSGRLSGVVGCAALAWFQWWAGLALLLLWLAVRWSTLRVVTRQATEFRGQTTAMRRAWYFTSVASRARDAKEVRVFGLADFLSARFRREYSDALRAGVPGMRSLHRRALAGFVAVMAGYAALLYYLADAATHGHLSLQGLAILLPMLAVTMSVGSVSYDDIVLAWSLGALPDLDRLEAELGSAAAGGAVAGIATADRPAAPATDSAPTTGSITFRDISFRYPGGSADVLHGLDLELAAGRSTAIVGVNGAGKSTLVSLLARLREPTGGEIACGGWPITGFDARSWQRRIALLPQDPVHYPVSARDNIAFGAIEFAGDDAGIAECAELSGFAAVAADLPAGLDTVLTTSLPGGVDLSGGQWQRLALARALFATRHGATVLVLDEPTAALDIRAEAAFYERFLAITGGLTTVLISHRFATVRLADEICVLDGGAITERGSHRELLATHGQYAEMYQVQAARFGASATAGRSR